MKSESYWTNASVLSLAPAGDPIATVVQQARDIILRFMEAGNEPPFDPIEIAKFVGITVIPSVEVRDARTVFVSGRPCVEFNPNRPKSRIRYSICHEIIHTLFPDWKDEIRYRTTHQDMKGDGWQLEMLCNIGAAELLMPIGTFCELQNHELSIDNLLQLRALYEVSTEALLLRIIRLTKTQGAVFSASRIQNSDRYRIDYSIQSASFSSRIPNGLRLPANSIIGDCTAIGFTSKGVERWPAAESDLRIECVGIAPYPYQTYPRVMGIATPIQRTSAKRVNEALVLKGDATTPRKGGNRIVAFIVNDKTPRWGAGFALAVRRKWPHVQDEFVKWVDKNPSNLKLGNIHAIEIEPTLVAVALIAQRGYGDSPKPRIRYNGLYETLKKLADLAKEQNASIHMPRIGSGQARGHWPIIAEMIEQSLINRGIDVTIYDLPSAQPKQEAQGFLSFSNPTAA